MPLPVVIVLVLAAAGYLAAVLRVRHWPVGRALCFFAALVVAAIAAGGSVNTYSRVLFSMHMVQHLSLIMIVPALLVLGRPLTLLHSATSGRARQVLGRIRRSRVIAVLTHPVLAFIYYTVVVVGTHLSPFQENALVNPAMHGVEELLYVSSGYLLLLSVLGGEPGARALSHLMRLVVLMGGMVVDTIVGITLLMTPSEPFPTYRVRGSALGIDALNDLHVGGAIMWVGGDTLMAALAIVVITQWINSPSRGNDLGPWLEAARRSAIGGPDLDAEAGGSQDSSYNIDDDEEALRRYNAMLARLASQEQDGRVR